MRAREFIKNDAVDDFAANVVDTTQAVKSGSMTPAQAAKSSVADIDQAISQGKNVAAGLQGQISAIRDQLKTWSQSPPPGTTVQSRSGTVGNKSQTWAGRTAAGNPIAGGAVTRNPPAIEEQELDETGLTWREYPCTIDCSGHQAGDKWAQARGIKDPNLCPPGNSNSWHEGCRSEAEGRPY